MGIAQTTTVLMKVAVCSEVSSVFKPGESFIEGASEPHYVENKGDTPTVVWVMVASVEGLPTTEWIK